MYIFVGEGVRWGGRCTCMGTKYASSKGSGDLQQPQNIGGNRLFTALYFFVSF